LHAVTIGSKRVVTRAEGLQGSPPIREVKTVKGQQSGAYIRSKYLDARYITLEMEVIGSSIEDSFDEFDTVTKALMSSVSTAGTLKWTRDSGGQALQVDCQLSSLAPLVLTDGGNMLSSQITFVAGDPRVYDQSLTTGTGTTITDAALGGTVSYTNAGSIATPPKIRIYGGITNPWVRKGTVAASVGASLVFSGTVAPGDYLEIDVQARTVKTNGTTNALSLLTAASSDWFELPTGASTVCMTGSAISGSPRVDLIYRSAWA
jgi:hypothetical protein